VEFFNYVVKPNMGMIDRVIRIFAGIAFFAGAAFSAPIMGPLHFGGVSVLLGAIGLILIIVGLIGLCPLYLFVNSWFDLNIKTLPSQETRVERMERSFRSGGGYW